MGYSGEDISCMGGRSLNAVSVIYTPPPRFCVDVKVLKIIIEVDGAGTKISPK